MNERLRFHLDESVDTVIAAGLRRRGIDVTTTPEARLRGASDSAQLEQAALERRVVVSHDPDFLRLSESGVAHWGIAFATAGTRTVGEIVRRLTLMVELMKPMEMRGRVEYL